MSSVVETVPVDNIVEPETPVSDVATPVQEKKQLVIELYDMTQAIEKVASYYERNFKEISFRFPSVVAEGSVVEFVDLQTNSVLAKFILRMLNAINMDETTCQMSVPVLFSDMMVGTAMNTRAINIDLKPKETK